MSYKCRTGYKYHCSLRHECSRTVCARNVDLCQEKNERRIDGWWSPGVHWALQGFWLHRQDLFLEYLQHFVSQVKCSKEHKVLLILDGHTSHTKSIAVIDFARDNGIILMSLPPHTTHRLQPLDTPLFKSVESYYDEAVRQWLCNHPGRAVTTWQVAGLFAEAYGRAATIQTAVNGFRSTGIMPYDPNVIPDHMYAPSDVTDTPMANVTQNVQEPQPSTSSEPQPSMSEQSCPECTRPAVKHDHSAPEYTRATAKCQQSCPECTRAAVKYEQ